MQRELIEQDGLLVDITRETLPNLHAVADHCQRLRSAGLTGEKNIRTLGIVPAFLVEKWINDRGIAFTEFMRNPEIQTQMLNDPALAAFRVHEGAV